jgi:AcrR family transcriptional regulator
MAGTGALAAIRGGKRERNKAENRAAILAAARRVFAELGYEAATIRDVIGATNLAAGTFYNYFPDKESVLRALLDGKMNLMLERWQKERIGADTVDEIVRRSLGLSFAMVAEDTEVFALLHRNAGALRGVLDEPGFLANRRALQEDLRRALKRPGAPALDVEYLTAAITGLAVEVAASALDRDPTAMQDAAAFATSMVLGGIRASAATPTRAATGRATTSPAAPSRTATGPAATGSGTPPRTTTTRATTSVATPSRRKRP